MKNHRTVRLLRTSCAGSYTVEAAFLFPMFVVLFTFILLLSIHWYETVQSGVSDISALSELDTRAIFLNRSLLSELTNGS